MVGAGLSTQSPDFHPQGCMCQKEALVPTPHKTNTSVDYKLYPRRVTSDALG